MPMIPQEPAVQGLPAGRPAARVVNDFSIQVATVNGSGSQTANLVCWITIMANHYR